MYPVTAGRHYTASAYVQDKTGTGSIVGVKPMMLKPAEWGVDQVMWLPGGDDTNAIEIDDSNFIDGDLAHATGAATSIPCLSQNGSVVRSTLYALFGANSFEVTADGAGSVGLYAKVNKRTLVTPDTAYTFSVSIYVPTGQPSPSMFAQLEWRDNTDSVISASNGTTTSLTVGNWTRIFVTATAPANADRVGVGVFSTGTPANGRKFYFDQLALRYGSASTFVPSTRLKEIVDVRIRAALADWSVADTSLMRGWGYSWSIWTTASGSVKIVAYDNAGTRHDGIIPNVHAVDDENPAWFRFVLDPDTTYKASVAADRSDPPPLNAYQQWGSVAPDGGTGWKFGTDIINDPADPHTNARGAYMYMEIRDGENGPVVFQADFGDSSRASAEVWTTPEGQTVRIKRGGNATAEIVSRDCWAFTGDGEISLPGIVVDAHDGNDLTVMAGLNTRATDYGRVLANGAGQDTDPGWGLLARGTDIQFGFSDGTLRETGSLTTDMALWQYAGWFIDGDDITPFVEETDGVTESLSTYGAASTPDALTFGAMPNSNGRFSGLVAWVAILSRVLTPAERTELAEWNGNVASEPSWLRADPELVLYLNASDPDTSASYAEGNIPNVSTPAQKSARIVVEWLDAGDVSLGSIQSDAVLLSDLATVRPRITGVAPSDVAKARLRVTLVNAAVGNKFVVDGVLFEESNELKDYFDASFLGGDYIWEGVAHNSKSHYYANRSIKNARLDAALQHYAPIGTTWVFTYAQS